MSYFKEIPQYLSGITEEDYKPRQGSNQVRSDIKSANHCTLTFGLILTVLCSCYSFWGHLSNVPVFWIRIVVILLTSSK